MTPFTTVYVWLQSQFASETIITKIVGKNTKVQFGSGTDTQKLKYDANLGVFVKANQANELVHEDDSVTLYMPTIV
jgi:putative ubiquitin-RnfH superfamily antitoxin RatB of RatAB toxin-antitoxin module